MDIKRAGTCTTFVTSTMPREGEEVTEAVPVAVAVEKADREGVAEGGGVPVVA